MTEYLLIAAKNFVTRNFI